MLVKEGRILAAKNATIVKEALINASSLPAFLDALPTLKSITSISLKEDEAFLAKVEKLLSSFASIFYKPHISSRFEDTIIRGASAPSINEESFRLTVKDISLWKKKRDGSYAPEYVHYAENVDLVRTYENLFVVMVLHEIERLLDEYEEDYLPSLSNYRDDSLALKGSDLEKLFSLIARCRKRIVHLKEMPFYQEVNAGSSSFHFYKPTNILLKDPDYHRIYEFYAKEIQKSGENGVKEDLCYSYFVFFLKSLVAKGYKYQRGSKKELKAIFKRDQFILTFLTSPKDGRFEFTVEEKNSGETIHHVLFIDDGYRYSGVKPVQYDETKDENGVLSIFAVSSLDKDAKPIRRFDAFTTSFLVNEYIDELTLSKASSFALFSHYCPVCQSKRIEKIGNRYYCHDDQSEYILYTKGKEEMCWIYKLGKKHG